MGPSRSLSPSTTTLRTRIGTTIKTWSPLPHRWCSLITLSSRVGSKQPVHRSWSLQKANWPSANNRPRLISKVLKIWVLPLIDEERRVSLVLTWWVILRHRRTRSLVFLKQTNLIVKGQQKSSITSSRSKRISKRKKRKSARSWSRKHKLNSLNT